ncbi:MAG: PAS domain S-box protein [Hyphomicrobium sp.]|uniref:PAS domain S-box protein n=1 Tax=Hyphomicrobium sp. TaxID=82 RepID=UPI001323DB74|nr:PAS domain S-box protein [Hyphomicrobium sp.]KAB2943496.1 MAG: PAS domain S-box protein [Hyphomicrobium sp.]MBZ0210744.1 PAS domain S-box protein [Hyphomicrobium sp.]
MTNKGFGEPVLEASLHQLAAILQSAIDAIISIDALGTIESVNPATEKMFGYTAAELIGQNVKLLMPEPYRRDHDSYIRQYRHTGQRRIIGLGREVTGQRKDGSTFPMHLSVSEYEIGGKRHFAGVVRDLTHQAQQEEVLRRSQRMDVLGQLTGGIAHDFNNLLTIIIGSHELAEETSDPEKVRELMRRANEAAHMGARLTSRLLSFSRQRKLEPAVINLNEHVLGMLELLRRSLGETISLTTSLVGDLWSVCVDPSEIENAVLNLSLNSRDAMPQGGNLSLETRNHKIVSDDAEQYGLAPGEYVRLTVSDTGSGMTPEVAARVFEPFFTTKPVGRGTGLGLASTYGFVKQSGGSATIYSEVGRGTTVNLYLPRHGAQQSRLGGDTPVRAPCADDELVLVVEDNPELRALTLDRLKCLGYRVIEADGGPAALAILEAGEPIDLIFSDVIMPGGITGNELAAAARERNPAIKILLTSGYDAELAVEADTMADDLKVLRKPYKQADLARALRDILDS